MIPKYKKFASITPMMLSRSTTGRKVNITPQQEQIMFNKIAWIILNLTNFVKGIEPREQVINTQTININIT